MISNNRGILYLGPVILVIILFSVTGLPFYSVLGVGLFLFFGLKFYFDLGKTIEIRDLIILIALLQWIIGPVLKYNLSPEDIFYFMAVSEKEYMRLAFPAALFFIAGLYFPLFYKKLNSKQQLNKIYSILNRHPNIDLILIVIGVLADISEDFMPDSLKFFMFLLGGSRFIGLFFLVLNNRSFKWPIFGFVMILLFASTIRHAIFHELILWMVFLFIIIAFLYRFRDRQKLAFLIPIIVLTILIQTVKFYFRQETGKLTGTFDKAELFTEMIQKELVDQEHLFTTINFEASIDRINQGWIVARIMRYTPDFEPFAGGETIITGIRASLIPRFLDPDKPKAGGRDNFTRFTGKLISDNTSMGLSPLGEAYANFGINGGIIFMFLLGLFYNFYLFMLLRLSDKYPSLILWIPLLFLQVVKAETDFVVVLNHLVKASIVVALLIFSFRKFFGIRI
ncbi:MAG: hypothetical protein ABFS35_10250 [Bacteroidota bacterium]